MYLLNTLVDEANQADIDGNHRRLMFTLMKVMERAEYLKERAWADYNREGDSAR